VTDFQIEGPTILLPVLIFQSQRLFEGSTPIGLTAIWSTARRKAMGSFSTTVRAVAAAKD
jgi:hypothetical protein